MANEKGWFTHWIAIERDVTEKKINELQSQLQTDIGIIFNQTEELKVTFEMLLKHAAHVGNFQIAEFWMRSEDDDTLKLFSTFAIDGHFQEYFNSSKELTELKIGSGLAGTIWKSNLINVWDDIDQNDEFLRKASAQQVGIKSAFGIPIACNGKLLGVLMFGASRNLSSEKNNLKVFYGLKTFLGEEIRRKKQEEEMFLMFQSAPEVLAVLKPNGYFGKVNPAFCGLLGYSKVELLAMSFQSLVHPNDFAKTQQMLADTLTGLNSNENFFNRFVTKTGKNVWIAWNTSKSFGEDGQVFVYGRDITETLELQKLLDNAIQLSRVGAWEFDLKSNEIYWSPMSRQIHEIGEDFILNQDSAVSFLHPNCRASVIELIKQAVENENTFDLEILIVTGKGNERWVRIISNMEYVNGVCVKIIGSFQDIHQRKIAEIQTVKLFEERNNILESIGDGFVTIDKNWNFTYLNRSAEAILSTTRKVLLGNNVWEMFPDIFETEFHQRFVNCFETQQAQHFEAFYEGLGIWIDMSVYATDVGISIFFKNISDKKQIEERIRQSNERFEKVTLATNDAIWDLDLVQNTLFWGGGYKTIFGYNVMNQTESSDSRLELIHAKDKKRVTQSLYVALKNTNVFNWEAEYRYQRADGHYAYIIDRGVIIREINGKAIRMVGAMSDITQRKETEEYLKKLNKQLENQTQELAVSNAELEQFAYVASHDLQEPLRMITSFLVQLEKKYTHQLDEKAHQYIDFAVDGAKRMRQIILDLLDFSRVGKFDEDLEKVDLNDVMNEVMQLTAKSIYESGTTIEVAKLPEVSAFRSPMIQVFQNLISNAIKYRKADEKLIIVVQSKEEEKYWEISVTDNGIGIESEYFEKIFVIFQRLHNKNEYSGTGMGLSIVKKIVENFGGKIWVESDLGKGSTFTFIIPKK